MPSDERSLPGGDDGESLLPDVLANSLPMHPEDTLLVVATMDGVVHAVEGASGALLWSFDSGGKLLSSSSLDRLQEQADAAAAGSAPTATDWQFGEAAQDADGERPAWDAATEREMARGKGETRHLPLPLPLPHGPPPSPEAGGPHESEEAGAAGSRSPPPMPRPYTPPVVRDGAAPMPATQPGTSVASPRSPHGGGEQAAAGSDDASCLEEGGGTPGMEGAARAPFEAAAEAEDELVLLPGLDGSIYVLGEGDEPQRLTEHTVQVLTDTAATSNPNPHPDLEP